MKKLIVILSLCLVWFLGGCSNEKSFIYDANNEIVNLNIEDLKTINEKSFVIVGLDDEFTNSLCERVKTVIEIKEMKIYKVIFDKNEKSNKYFNIKKFPSLLVYANNKVYDIFEYYNEEDIKNLDKIKRVEVFGDYSMKIKKFIKKYI